MTTAVGNHDWLASGKLQIHAALWSNASSMSQSGLKN